MKGMSVLGLIDVLFKNLKTSIITKSLPHAVYIPYRKNKISNLSLITASQPRQESADTLKIGFDLHRKTQRYLLKTNRFSLFWLRVTRFHSITCCKLSDMYCIHSHIFHIRFHRLMEKIKLVLLFHYKMWMLNIPSCLKAHHHTTALTKSINSCLKGFLEQCSVSLFP